MKKGFYAGLVILAFLMVLMTPSDHGLLKLVLWEAVWIPVLLGTIALFERACEQ